MLIDNLRQLMDSLAKFDSTVADSPVDSHHAVLFLLVDDIYLFDALDFFLQASVALFAEHGELLTTWAH